MFDSLTVNNKVTTLTNNLFLSDDHTKKQMSTYYTDLCRPVKEMFDSGKKQIRKELFCLSGIAETVKKLVGADKSCPGMVICYGTKNYVEFIVTGAQQEYAQVASGEIVASQERMTLDSIFDLASVTKFFTCLTLFKLFENGSIDFQSTVSEYDKRFENIGHLTIQDLMGFQRKLVTPVRIDQITDPNEAERILFEISDYANDLRPYSDIGAIVLQYIVETITREPFFDSVQKFLLIPNHMVNTNISYSGNDIKNLVSNNFELRLSNSKLILDSNTDKGRVHDRKARVLGRNGSRLSGHAGLFSTATDMSSLLQNVLKENVICKKNLLKISETQIGFCDKTGEYSQYLGLLCHTKHPKKVQSEVYSSLSDSAFAQGGYTGTYFSLDPLNGVFVFLGTNRCHHRITSIQNCPSLFAEQYKRTYPISKNFAWDRDDLCHCALNLALQYQYLEELGEKDMPQSQQVYYL